MSSSSSSSTSGVLHIYRIKINEYCAQTIRYRTYIPISLIAVKEYAWQDIFPDEYTSQRIKIRNSED
jgi:hypothetical protein